MNDLHIFTLFCITLSADFVVSKDLLGFGYDPDEYFAELDPPEIRRSGSNYKMDLEFPPEMLDEALNPPEMRRNAFEPPEVPHNDLPEIRRRGHHKSALRIKNQYPGLLENGPLRIKGGNVTDTANYPYMAAIMVNGRLWCAGAIVDINWVITAAHCLNYVLHVSPMKTLGKYVKVRVGSVRPHEGGVLVDVAGAVRHPKFEEEPVPHADVALLKLTENLELNRHVNILRIYGGMREPYAQSFIVVSGWGATRGSDTAFREHTPELLAARLKVRTQHYCVDSYQLVNNFLFTEDFFCASLRNGTRDACLFDAGAPAVQQNMLMGIMSFGPERCGGTQPAVFIKAFYFKDFVKATISAYKSTNDLMHAMEVLDPTVKPHVHTVDHIDEGVHMWEEVTHPDEKHDRKRKK